jgi:hypothetical protein
VRLLLSLFLCALTSNVICQTQGYKNQDKIIEVYGIDWFQSRFNENSSILDIMDKYVSYGFSVEEIIEEKYQDQNALKEIPLVSKNHDVLSIWEFLSDYENENFNPLKYSFFPTKEEQFYFLKDSNKIIRIRSIQYLNSI